MNEDKLMQMLDFLVEEAKMNEVIALQNNDDSYVMVAVNVSFIMETYREGVALELDVAVATGKMPQYNEVWLETERMARGVPAWVEQLDFKERIAKLRLHHWSVDEAITVIEQRCQRIMES